MATVAVGISACADTEPLPDVTAAYARVCDNGAVIDGIDVSYYQGVIDWTAVANDGYEFAFIRVSDGINTPDTQFANNWAGAKAAGVVRGVYQYFRPNQDPIAQANLLLDRMGPLGPDDLPPVLDLETRGGQSAAVVISKAQQWLDHVEAATGRRPIIYTAAYFWRDELGAPDFTAYPLWAANYGADCPLMPDPWTAWKFWQYTDSGSVAGSNGPTDLNVFNGTLADLYEFVGGPDAPSCGDNRCDAAEIGICVVDCPACAPLPAAGGIIDDGACFSISGESDLWPSAQGSAWAASTVTGPATVTGQWLLATEGSGNYHIEAWAEPSVATATSAGYRIGLHTFSVDQSQGGWVSVGRIAMSSREQMVMSLGNESNVAGETLVFDAIRLTADPDAPEPEWESQTIVAGCHTGRAGGWALLALAGLAFTRRRRVA